MLDYDFKTAGLIGTIPKDSRTRFAGAGIVIMNPASHLNEDFSKI
jgi:hypothetical protein